MSTRLLIAMVCLAVSLGCSRVPRSGLPNAIWDDGGSSDFQSIFILRCRYGNNLAAGMDLFGDDEAASMHSLEDEWIVSVYASKVDADNWKIGIQPYPTAADAQRAAEHYVDFYRLCPSQSATSNRAN